MHCIQCKERPAKLRERHQPQNVYCGRLCQLGFHLIGLGTDDNIVGLQADDGTKIEITLEQARQMKTIENFLEDAGSEFYIPVPNIDGPTLIRIKTYLTYSPKLLYIFDDKDFIKLLKAANYLDFKNLLLDLLPLWLDRLSFPGPPELHHISKDALFFSSERAVIDPILWPDEARAQQKYAEAWPLIEASRTGRIDIVDRLLILNRPRDPGRRRLFTGSKSNEALKMAVRNGHIEIVERLLKDPRTSTTHVLGVAASRGNWAIMERLLKDDRVDPSEDNNTPLIWALRSKNYTIIDLLLRDSRVDPELLRPHLDDPKIEALYHEYSKNKRQRI